MRTPNFNTKSEILIEVLTDYETNKDIHSYYGRIPPNSRGVTLYQYDRMQKLYKEGLSSYQNDWSTFKLRSYWKAKKDGTLYTPFELASQKNVTTTDSYDWIPTKSEQVYYINEQISCMKLLKFMKDHKKNAFMFMLFANIGSLQYMVAYWNHKEPQTTVRNYIQFKSIELNGIKQNYVEGVSINNKQHISNLGALSPSPYEFTDKHKMMQL